MEYRIRITVLLLVVFLSLTRCKKVDYTGVIFYEESANERFEDSERWNNLNPFREIILPADNYSILSVSDIHVGTTDNLDKFNSIALSLNPAAIVMTGDLTWGKKENYELLQQHLPDKDALITFLIAGNHDCNFKGWNEYFTRFGSSTYIFKIQTPVATDLFICLETAGATIGKKQFDWLINILEKERAGCRHCIIYTHTNIFRFKFSEASNPQTEEIIALLELVVRNRIDMVITGHDHRKDEVKFGNTTYIVIPPLLDGHASAGYFRLDVKDGKLDYRFVSL